MSQIQTYCDLEINTLTHETFSHGRFIIDEH